MTDKEETCCLMHIFPASVLPVGGFISACVELVSGTMTQSANMDCFKVSPGARTDELMEEIIFFHFRVYAEGWSQSKVRYIIYLLYLWVTEETQTTADTFTIRPSQRADRSRALSSFLIAASCNIYLWFSHWLKCFSHFSTASHPKPSHSSRQPSLSLWYVDGWHQWLFVSDEI